MYNIGDLVVIDKGEHTELTGTIAGHSLVTVQRGFNDREQMMYIVDLDEGGYLRPSMAKVDEIKGYVSLLVVHPDNLTLME